MKTPNHKTIKIIWKVSDVPTGRYKSFEKREWPSAYYGNADGDILAALYCEDEYIPADVKTGNHGPIKINVANHSVSDKYRFGAFRWHTLMKRASTLKEAKEIVSNFYKKRPDWLPSHKEREE